MPGGGGTGLYRFSARMRVCSVFYLVTVKKNIISVTVYILKYPFPLVHPKQEKKRYFPAPE